jgi:hypothetical protein
MQSKIHHVILCSRHLISSLLENCSVLDLLTPVFPQRFLVLASLGYLLQAMGRGLAAPSNQVVHTHFAISENVGDVLAKEEVWTVAAELCGLALGVCILDGTLTRGVRFAGSTRNDDILETGINMGCAQDCTPLHTIPVFGNTTLIHY